MRKNSIKNIRINAEVQRELSRIIQQEIKDPRIHPMTTVVMAEVTPDLKYCKAYISVLGNEEAQKSTMEGLKNAKPYIRRMLASSVNLRNTPELTFVLDQSIEYGVHMTGLIDAVANELAAKEPSIIISRRPCVMIKGTVHKPAIAINQDACKGCKACMQIGCPAISFKDKKAHIDPTLCIGCEVCKQMCRFDAIGM